MPPTEKEMMLSISGFRKGYQQGYHQALQDIKRQLEMKYPIGKALEISQAFVTDDLFTWRSNEPAEMIEPPEMFPVQK